MMTDLLVRQSVLSMVKRHLHHAKTLDQKPTVLVVGDLDFVGFYLSKLLRLKNCRLISTDQFLQKKIEGIDYIFYLAEKKIEEFKMSLEMAEKFGSKLLLTVYQDAATEEILKDLQARKIDWRIVRLGFVYGPRMNLKSGGALATFIKSAVEDRPIRISGSGSEKIYPTFISDVVYGLMKTMFSPGTGGKIFTLVNPKAVTLLDFAQLLKDQSQKSAEKRLGRRPESLRIEFIPEQKTEMPLSVDKALKSQADLGWKAKVGVKEGIEQTLKYFETVKKPPAQKSEKRARKLGWKLALPTLRQTEPARPKKKEEKERPISRFSYLILIPSLLISFLLYPFISLAYDSLSGIRNLKGAQEALIEADFKRASKKARVAQQAFTRANQRIQQFYPFFDFVDSDSKSQNALMYLEESTEQLEKLFIVGQKAAESLTHLSQSAQSAAELGTLVLQNQPGDIKNLLAQIKVELDYVYGKLSLIEAETKKEKGLLPARLSGWVQELNLLSRLPEVRNLILQAQKGIEIIPEVIGIEGKRVYLVLLQNNMELRPTGGFIGSFALATFEEGRLVDFAVEDVYTADGQLKGHVEPPPELKKYLGEAGWYLRDSNWHPDFPTSALRAEWFLEKETGRVVDGVIGVNLFLAQNVLEQTGEVEVFDFQEKINHHNLFERAEYHSETGFFPGSTQKKDFLGSLARALFEKIENSEEKTWLSLARAIYQATNEKSLVAYLHEPQTMKVISDLGWDGRVGSVKCLPRGEALLGQVPDVKCVADYLMIVEANVGVNKANYFVKRNLTHQVKIDQKGTIKEVLQIRYQNQSESENFPAGRYKNYLRVLVPQRTKLEGVAIDGKKIEEEKIDIDEVMDKTSFGILVEVPIKEEKTVEVAYQLTEKVDFAKMTQYLFLLQKQPGIKDESFSFWLTVPEGVSFLEPSVKAKTGLSLAESPTQSLNTLLFKPEFNQDLVFEVEVGR